MSTMQTQPQEAQAEATIQRIDFDQGSGWYTILTDQGEFSTKFPEPAQEAQRHVGQRVSIVYQQAEPRQGRNGQWYQSRYLRRIVSGYAQPQQAQFPPNVPQGITQGLPQQVAPQPTAPPATDQSLRGTRRGEMEIMRQTAGKLAVATMPLVPSEERTFANQIMVAEAWLRYFIHGHQEPSDNEPPPW